MNKGLEKGSQIEKGGLGGMEERGERDTAMAAAL